MKLNRRQLRKLIRGSLLLEEQGNNENNYENATDEIIALIYKESGKPKKEGEFSHEIFPGKKGKWFQFNFNGIYGEAHSIAQGNMLKKSTDMQREATEIVKKYLNVVPGQYSGLSGNPKSYHSWLLEE
jgi:hypothetical protein